MTDEEIRALVDAFRQRADADPEIRSVMRKIRNQDADFSDTSRMFWRRSELLRDYLQGVVLDLPAGAREQLCTALLNAGYNETNKVMQSVQQAQDEPQGIHLNPVLPKRPAERIHTVAHALEDPTIPDDKIVRRAGAPVANVQMSFHDRYIEENAKIRAKLGMKPTITRYGSGCCKWCSEVAGKYRFGEQPDGIFRRHDNCDCVIIYDNQVLRGRETSSGRSKTWEEVRPEDVLADGFSPKIFSQSEAEELQERLMQGLTLAGERDIMRVADSGSIYHKITDESIRNVPLVDAFGDAEKNERYREANRALLREAAKYEPGVEVSMVYDADMKAIDGFGYVLGEMGRVRIENPGVPFHAFHNHGSAETLSFADARAFVNNSSWISVTAVGNTGSVYSLTRTAYSDSFGFGCFLRNKSRTVIFSAEGTDFTLEKIADENVSKDLKLIVSRLPAEQKKSLADAILSQTEKCLKGGAKYGFKYTEITP